MYSGNKPLKFMKKILFLFFFLSVKLVMSQEADNSFYGYFEEKGDNTFYKSFSFDGNGKVLIADMDYGDYFTRNDSLIVYPDKSIFIFKIKKDKLTGASEWVKKGTWIINKDSTQIDKREISPKSKGKAELLAEYYDKTKNTNDLDALFSEEFPRINEELCNKGLAKACLNLFGIKMLEYTPGLLSDPDKIASKKIKPHPELIALSKKIVSLGEPEGYTVLGSYYYTLGMRKEAFQIWDKGEQNGSTKSGLTKATIEFEEELKKADQQGK
ncbi:hypothetical protein CHRYSEOSP005_23570 [Chryseobacterium sp. Alg-005]|uniref:hypothetical protein n=1 Tax=Chryseobacterium sp. Alg-005 TaxID=3159516 RepID=UPI0035558FD9